MKTVIAVILAASVLPAGPGAVQRAAELYQRTEYRQALEALQPELNTNPEAMLLAGKSWFMLGEFKKATEVLQKAVAADPRSSHVHHWLGKAWGRRAETSSFLTAPRYAGNCREAFEKAVQLDPDNIEAMNDLLEYYLEAPGFLGGGFDKAEALAARIAGKDSVEQHYALARLAEKRAEFQKAEHHLRRAAELAPNQIGRVIDLARFLAKRGKVGDSEAAFQQAAALAPKHPKLLFGRAEVYIETRRNLDQARQLLREYLQADLTPEDPPREEAERLLRLANNGS